MAYLKVRLAEGADAESLARCCRESAGWGCLLEPALLRCPLNCGQTCGEEPERCAKVAAEDWKAVMEEDNDKS